MNRKIQVLCVLLVVLAGSLVYSFLHSPKEQRVTVLKNPPGGAATATRKIAPAPAGNVGDDTGVHLALLDRELPRFSGFRRNIFSPIFREELKLPPFKPLPLPLPPRPVVALPPPPQPPQPVQVPPTPEQAAAQADAVELAKFTFLGFLKKDGAKTVFLSSNNEIFLAKKGSNLGQKYLVSDLTDDSLTIKSIVGGRELVIPLVENRALSTRRTSTRNP
jgi:hypothetical protein